MSFTIDINHNNCNYTVKIILGEDFTLLFDPPYFRSIAHSLYIDDFNPNIVDENFYYKMTQRHLPPQVIQFCNRLLELKVFL